MPAKKVETKKVVKKPVSKKTVSKSKASGTTYNVTCDASGNITKIIPAKKK